MVALRIPSEDDVRRTYERLAKEIPELRERLPVDRVLLRLNTLSREILESKIQKTRGGSSELRRLLSSGDPRDEALAIYCIIATAAETPEKEKEKQQDAEEESLEDLLSQIDPLEEDAESREGISEPVESPTKQEPPLVESPAEESSAEVAEEESHSAEVSRESEPADGVCAGCTRLARSSHIIQALKSTVVRLCRERDMLRKSGYRKPVSEEMINTMLRAISKLGEVFTPAEVHAAYVDIRGKNVKKGTVTRAVRELRILGYIEHVRLGDREIRGYYRLTEKGRERLGRLLKGK